METASSNSRSIRRRRVLYTIVATLLVTARPASAQYTAQLLEPPAVVPQTALGTRVFSMNNAGQLFGEVLVTAFDRRPVLWTNGVGDLLTIPDGYAWDDYPGQQFVNDAGTVVAKLYNTSGTISYVGIWQHGVPNVLDPTPLQASCSYRSYYPIGINSAGDIAIVGEIRTDNGSNLCENMWIRHADGTAQAIPPRDPAGIDHVCELTYSAYLSSNHLNDAGHLAMQRVPIAFGAASNCFPFPEVAGVFAGGGLSPITTAAFAAQINNHDQVLLLQPNVNNGSPTWALWDGSTIVNLGAYLGVSLLNDLGQVVLTDRGGVKKYANGAVTTITLPTLPSQATDAGVSMINNVGQLAGSAFFAFNGPFGGPAQERAILFTPPAPITPTISWTPPGEITYGTALSAAQLSATASVPGTFAYSPAAGTVLGAGAHTLSVIFTPTDPSFTQATSTVTINVRQAGLTISANGATKVFGAPLPAFAASYSGFVNGDSPASLAGALALTTPAVATSPVGQYAIAPGGVSSANYAITFVNGTLTVTPASTAVGLVSSAPSSVAGQAVTFTATVTPVAPGAGTPSGSVTFSDGATVLGTVPLSNGIAALTTSTLGVGTHTMTAQYGGDPNFTANSRSVVQTVAIIPIVSWAAPADITYGTAVGAPQLNATANVPGAFVYTPAAGTVLGAGARTLSVRFTPTDPSLTPSTSTVTINVRQAGLTISANGPTKVFGAPLPAFAASYSGFVNGDSPASLAGALALTTPAVATSPVGQYAIAPGGVSSANYAITFVNGTLTVTPASTAVGLVSSAPSSVAGQAVTFTATVTPVAPGAGTPSGSVTFSDGATVLGTVPLSNGIAALTTSTLGVGTHTITAQYGGAANFTGNSRSVVQTVATPLYQLTATTKFVRDNIGQWVATITIKNVGIGIVGARVGTLLNGVGSVDASTFLGDFPTGASRIVFSGFPGTAGAPGSANNALRIQVNGTNATISISQRVALP